MIWSIRKLDWRWTPILSTALIVAALAAVLAVYSAPTAHASDPPGDCWGRALSADPLHCYALEEAQRDGIIEVEGVYTTGSELYIYFDDLRDSGTRDDLNDLLEVNAREFAIQSPDRVTYGFREHRCSAGDPAETYRDCMLDYTFKDNFLVPWDSSYDVIRLVSGGAEARKAVGGWASWRQVWPSTASGGAGAYSGFDVSGVDVTNFPEVECVHPHDTESCGKFKLFAGFGIAGWHGHLNSKLYIQVKAAPGEEANVEAALREEFIRIGGPGADGGDNTVIIPVKYDYEELWRWQLVLDRFAVSSGNTIGITGGSVAENVGGQYEQESFLLTEAAYGSYSYYRETVHVWALDAQRVANALPTLLPLLSIPVDAVGVVGQYSTKMPPLVRPQPVSVTSASGKETDAPSMDTPSSDASQTQARDGDPISGSPSPAPVDGGRAMQGVSMWIIVGGGLVTGLVILGTVLGVSLGLRRRSSRIRT